VRHDLRAGAEVRRPRRLSSPGSMRNSPRRSAAASNWSGPAGRRSRRLSRRNRQDRVLRLPIGKGSESDPSRRNKGSSASTFDSDPEREALIEEAIGLSA